MGLMSRNKGKVGERAFVQWLHAHGVTDARRTAQVRGTGTSADVESTERYPRVFIEVKFGYPKSAFDIGSSAFANAIEVAEYIAPGRWCIAWKPKAARRWRMTMRSEIGIVTVDESVILDVMEQLNCDPAAKETQEALR